MDHKGYMYFWGPPHKDCQLSPSMPLPGEKDQQVGVLKPCESLLDPAAGVSAGTATDFDFDECGVAGPVISGPPGNVKFAGLNMFSHDVHDSDEEQEQFLCTCLEQLQLEKACLAKEEKNY